MFYGPNLRPSARAMAGLVAQQLRLMQLVFAPGLDCGCLAASRLLLPSLRVGGLGPTGPCRHRAITSTGVGAVVPPLAHLYLTQLLCSSQLGSITPQSATVHITHIPFLRMKGTCYLR